MDRFVYNYHTLGGQPSNRLNYVVDGGTDYSAYDDIKSGQTSGNYTYNKIGELIEDASEDMILHWRTGDHKLSKIERNDQDSPQIEFHYNPFGQRALKVEKPRISSVIQSAPNWKYTYYAYDANGQVMTVYSGNFQGTSEQVKLSEQHLYGAERLGMINRDVVVFDNGVTSYTHKEEDVVHEDERGYKRYELTNHLGNVLAVINDRKIYNSTDQNYEPVMMSWSDFYAGGMLQPGRHSNSDSYRYLFNGMEHDGEISGSGNSYTTEFRQYDPRLMRWKSMDPLMAGYPHMSPYVAFNNNPIYFIDPLGLEGEEPNDGGGGGKKTQPRYGSGGESAPGGGEPEKSKPGCASGDCQAYRTPNRIPGAVNEQGNVFLPKSADVTQIDDKNRVTRFIHDDDAYVWDSEKNWYYGVITGKEYYEGEYSDGVSNNFSPSSGGVSRAAEGWRYFIYSPFDAIADAWKHSDVWKTGYFTTYWGLTSYQKGAADGSYFTNFVEGLPFVVMTYGAGAGLKSFSFTSRFSANSIFYSPSFGPSSKLFGWGGQFGGVHTYKGLLNGVATPFVRIGWQMTSNQTMIFGLRLGANPNHLFKVGYSMNNFGFNLNYSIYNSPLGHIDLFKVK